LKQIVIGAAIVASVGGLCFCLVVLRRKRLRLLSIELIKKSAKGDSKAVESLISRGADVNLVWYAGEELTQDTEGKHLDDTHIRLSATLDEIRYSRSSEVSLLDSGKEEREEIEKKRHGLVTALQVACKECHFLIVQKLLSCGANPDPEELKKAPLWYAAKRGSFEIVSALIGHGANVNRNTFHGTTPLYLACQENHTKVADLLITHGADINIVEENGVSSLEISCQEGHLSIVKLLLESGAKKSYSGSANEGARELCLSAKRGHIHVLDYLISMGLNPNGIIETGESPLLLACHAHQTEVVKYLLERNVDTSKTLSGITPLHVVAQEGWTDLVEPLIESGSDVNVKSFPDGSTPIWLATQNCHTETVKKLVCCGADINIEDIQGICPIHIAAMKNNIEVVAMLLDPEKELGVSTEPASVNVQTVKNETPIYFAACYGNAEIAKMLIDRGAKLDVRVDGRTPLSMAKIFEHNDVVQLLEERNWRRTCTTHPYDNSSDQIGDSTEIPFVQGAPSSTAEEELFASFG